MGVPARAGDNGDDDVTPVARVNAVVKNSNDVENASATWNYGIPTVAFDGGKDDNAATGGTSGVSHAKGKKSASMSGFGEAVKGLCT